MSRKKSLPSASVLAEAIRRARVDKQLTQECLARELSVTVSTVNRWENSHAEPSGLARIALQRVLGLKVNIAA